MREDEPTHKTVTNIDYSIFEQALVLTNTKFYVDIVSNTKRHYYIDSKCPEMARRNPVLVVHNNFGDMIPFSAKVLYYDYIKRNAEPKKDDEGNMIMTSPIIEMMDIGTKDKTCKIHKILVDHDSVLKCANINTNGSQAIIFANFSFDVIKLYVDYLYLGRNAVFNIIKYDMNTKSYNYDIYELLSFADFVTNIDNDNDRNNNFLTAIVETNNIRKHCWLLHQYKDKISIKYYDEYIKIKSYLSDVLDKIEASRIIVNNNIHYIGMMKIVPLMIFYMQFDNGNRIYFGSKLVSVLSCNIGITIYKFSEIDEEDKNHFVEIYSKFRIDLVESKFINPEFIRTELACYDLETMIFNSL